MTHEHRAAEHPGTRQPGNPGTGLSFPIYREITPSAALRPWVDCFWVRGGGASAAQRVLPDGAADIIFDVARADAYAVGTMTAPLVVTPGTTDLLGVRFRPGRAGAVFGLPMAELTDRRVPMRELFDVRATADRVAVATDVCARVQVVEEALQQRVAAADVDGRIDLAIERILASGGALRVDPLAAAVGVTRQHLARRFLRDVGVTPKTFARVVRFQRLLEAIRRGELESWADAAYAHGYYDQSHLIAEFRELAGVTPTEFQISNRP